MKRLLITASLFALLTLPVEATVTAVTAPLSSSAWIDIGTGPLRIWASGRARYAISDSTPAAGMAGFPVSADPIDVTTTSDVWVMSQAPQYMTQVFYAPVTSGGGGGGGGAVTLAANAVAAGAYKVGSVLLGAFADGAIVTMGAEADAAWASGPGTEISILKTIAGSSALLASPLAVNLAINVTPTNCSITASGSAQNIITASASRHGATIANIDPTTGSGEPIWISFTGTAIANTAGSFPLPPPAATTLAGMGSWTAPPGFGFNTAISVIATFGHKISCTVW